MDYSLLVGIHHCCDSLQPADEASLSVCDASAGVFAVKCSSGLCYFFVWFILHFRKIYVIISITVFHIYANTRK